MYGSVDGIILQADRVLLRPWQVEDAAWYVQARDEDVFKWTTESQTLTIRETEVAIEQIYTRDDCFSFAIVDTEQQQLVGNLALARRGDRGRYWEVMYWLAPEGRGRGIASQAVRMVCQWALATQGIEQIRLKTHRDNLRSQRAAERAGFQRWTEAQEDSGQSDEQWFVLPRPELWNALAEQLEHLEDVAAIYKKKWELATGQDEMIEVSPETIQEWLGNPVPKRTPKTYEDIE